MERIDYSCVEILEVITITCSKRVCTERKETKTNARLSKCKANINEEMTDNHLMGWEKWMDTVIYY